MNALLQALISGRSEEDCLKALADLDPSLIDERIPEKTPLAHTESAEQTALSIAISMASSTARDPVSDTDIHSLSSTTDTPSSAEPSSMALQSALLLTTPSHSFNSNMSPFKKAFLTRSTARRRQNHLAPLPRISETEIGSNTSDETDVESRPQRLTFTTPAKADASPHASLRNQHILQTPTVVPETETKAWAEHNQTLPPFTSSANSIASESTEITFEVLLRDGDLIGGTALHIAVARSFPKVVAKLLEKGALANALNKGNLSPLYYALHMFFVDSNSLARDRRDIVSHLLRFGADLTISCRDGQSTNTTLLDIIVQYKEMRDYRPRYPFLVEAIYMHFRSLIQGSLTSPQHKIDLFYKQFVKILKEKHLILEDGIFSLTRSVLAFCKKMTKERKKWKRLQITANIASVLLSLFSIWRYIKNLFNARIELHKSKLVLPVAASSYTSYYPNTASLIGLGGVLTLLYVAHKAKKAIPERTWIEKAEDEVAQERAQEDRQAETGIKQQLTKILQNSF